MIEEALASCDELLILSYAKPEPKGCEAGRRERWLARRFPQARRVVLDENASLPRDDADDETHRRFVADVCRALGSGDIDAVFTSESYGAGFAASLDHSLQRPITHVAVDPARTRVPISGSQIRSDVHAHRKWLCPAVYASFVERVVLLGGESSGKSTLARSLAERFETEYVAEYGRERWVELGGELRFEDLFAIAEHQVDLEELTAERANRYLFCDTSPRRSRQRGGAGGLARSARSAVFRIAKP